MVCAGPSDSAPDLFSGNLRNWLRNKPREILIVTVSGEHLEQISAVVQAEVPPLSIFASKVHIFEVELPGLCA